MSVNFVTTLPYNAKNERPSRIIAYDVESNVDYANKASQRFTPFLWTAIYKRYRNTSIDGEEERYYGSSISDFWDMIDSHCYKKTKLYVFSHHLEVDFMPLAGFTELPKRGYKLDKLISHGRVLTMYWSDGTRKLIIANNGNLFDGSIEQWGKVFNIPKLDMPKQEDPIEQWVTYCMRDTEIVILMIDNLIQFMNDHDLGNWKLSKASLALTAFRHRFMGQKIAIHDNIPAILLERLSYKGGRFEALQIGDFMGQNFYSLDINSMYGYIESAYALPYELRGVKKDMCIDELIKRLAKYAVIADVNITIDEPCIPHKENDKIVYRSGTFDTVLCTPELEYVIKYGRINHIKIVAWYYKGYILKEYADYFLALKTEYDKVGNLPMRQVTKLYLNSLYGKFGQHGYNDKVIGECDPDRFEFVSGFDATTHERYDIAYYGGKVHMTEETLSGTYTATSIASHITSYGRLMLWQLIKKAGIENVYHVATDSLVVNGEGYQRLSGDIDPVIPGKLKLENMFTTYIVKDVNDTIQGDKIKVKGVPKKAIQIDEDTYEITEWPRLVSLLKQGILDYYYTRVVKKHLSRSKYHRTKGAKTSEKKTDKKGRLV